VFDAATAWIRRDTGNDIGKRQVQQLLTGAAVDFDAFYATRQLQRTAAGDVLVISVDGKGVVMLENALRADTAKKARSQKLKCRLSRGEKSNRKRMAEVGAVYEITPAARTPDDVMGGGGGKRPKSKAINKWLTASLVDDCDEVIASVFAEADRRDPQHQRQRVALVDGDRKQIRQIHALARERDITIPIIIDFIHVLEYLWKAAWAFHKEADPKAEQWVHRQAMDVLAGKAAPVARRIRRKANNSELPASKQQQATRCITYLTRNEQYLDYPTALSSGWPIATGIIEGACRHLVKDRMDITGARWGLPTAEAILKLRAITANDDLDEYWKFHLEQENQRNHTTTHPHTHAA